MRMFVDFQQYLLTAASLMPSALVSYVGLYWLAKLMAKMSGTYFGLSALGHLVFCALACALAPVAALWLVDRPADLMAGDGKALLAGLMGALVAMIAAQEFGPESESSVARSWGIRVLSGAATGAIAGVIAFAFLAIAMARNPKSQIDFSLGVLAFFVIVGALLGAVFVRRRPNKSFERTRDG